MKLEIVILVLLAFIAIFYVNSFTGLFVGLPTTHATKIIDGDTIEIATDNGPERVRLIGIDTPEKGQFLFDESKARLEELIGGKEILLETDETDRDKYNRLLRYIFLNRTELINTVLVREGLASVLIYPPDRKYEEELLKAEAEARNQNLGIWKISGIDDVFCIGIFYFRYNAMGDDRENLNDEYIEFRNKCTYPVQLGGWTVEDVAGHIYVFPEFTAQSKEKFKLITGVGNDTMSDLYWNRTKPIWNNAGDTMDMRNDKGQRMLKYTYEGY
jgi:endonuclease YncB( thermonuclease family)